MHVSISPCSLYCSFLAFSQTLSLQYSRGWAQGLPAEPPLPSSLPCSLHQCFVHAMQVFSYWTVTQPLVCIFINSYWMEKCFWAKGLRHRSCPQLVAVLSWPGEEWRGFAGISKPDNDHWVRTFSNRDSAFFTNVSSNSPANSWLWVCFSFFRLFNVVITNWQSSFELRKPSKTWSDLEKVNF